MTMTELALVWSFLGPSRRRRSWPGRPGRVADGLAVDRGDRRSWRRRQGWRSWSSAGPASRRSTAWSRIDALGGWTLLVVALVGGIALAGSPAYLRHASHDGWLRPHDRGRYCALLLWFVGGPAAVPLLDNLGLVWVAIEATTIVSALLVGFARTPAAIEAAWKYLILGSVGIGFALLGTLLAYASSVGVLGETSDALAWTPPGSPSRRSSTRAWSAWPSSSRWSATAPRPASRRSTPGCPTPTARRRARSRRCSRGAALAVSLYALARFHLVAAGAARARPAVDPAGRLRAAQPGRGAAVHRRPGRPQAAAGVLLGRAPGPGRAGPRVRRAHSPCWASRCTCWPRPGQVAACSSPRGGSSRGGRSRRIGRLRRQPRALAGRRPGVPGRRAAAGGLPPSALFVGELAIVFGGVAAGWGSAAGARGPAAGAGGRRASCSTSCASLGPAGARARDRGDAPATSRARGRHWRAATRSWLLIVAAAARRRGGRSGCGPPRPCRRDARPGRGRPGGGGG